MPMSIRMIGLHAEGMNGRSKPPYSPIPLIDSIVKQKIYVKVIEGRVETMHMRSFLLDKKSRLKNNGGC